MLAIDFEEADRLDRLRARGAHRAPPRPQGPPRQTDRTRAGRRLTDETIGRHVANEERLLSTLTLPEQKALDALLKKLIAGL